ncbi:MAG: ATP-binding protein [Deltaproteobacteria bacterium]|nr:ATP-binding protein [Deltaproteobacteria bacterium]
MSGATLSYFARYIQDIFFGFLVELNSESARKRQVNPKKFYLIDPGLHNYLTLNFSGNKGRVLENLVFLELRRKHDAIWYYKTRGGHEVDFVFQRNGESRLIQVCHDLSNIDSFSREKKALLAGMRELGIKTGLILTLNEKRVEEGDNYSLNIIPVWEWLLTSK